MAFAHNGIIRGSNSIYIQASHIPRDDSTAIQDFLIHYQRWLESMHHHHDAEEEVFFPSIERISNSPDIMNGMWNSIVPLRPALKFFTSTSGRVPPKTTTDGESGPLSKRFWNPSIQHFHDEIETLQALSQYSSELVEQAYKQLAKKLTDTDNMRLLLAFTYVIDLTSAVLVSDWTCCFRYRGQELRRWNAKLIE